ncbi:patatin-like phospholipase family protein [Geoalkalibacter halelectricus]|uniref:Patatin-like phospholipase family protein n=1 Tax=Geoalkalibacter halelectricus TaxID=2847045 RepID=A0ABY5ZR05_9BACT|nr:patatin-like phospholipase family protein [Geoalkalibacter halelectricus]MDO3377723.1 patatin-like phospholipase family protein [Geoalkalibacter halelectricus]UWZ81511.1 patatin-like phospholipase family protein [Geoalkalibacter halelectricus]
MARARSKTALILAGGGIMGAAYEIGCLTALERLFAPGFSVRRFDTYIGISAGSVIATLIANRIAPAALFEAIARNQRQVFNFQRSDIYRVEYARLLGAWWNLTRDLFSIFRSYRRRGQRFFSSELIPILQEQFPSGFFSLEPMQQYLCDAFRREQVRDRFHLLRPDLLIPAVDVDSGERVVFGTPEHRDLHVCQAITASCAIPAFFRPYRIGARYFIDGSVGEVAHVDLAIAQGAQLVVIINPLVPMHNDPAHACLPLLSSGKCSSIADLGLSYVWDQAQRIDDRRKLVMSLDLLRRNHPDVDIQLIEPDPKESLFFLQTPMSYDARRQVMTHGYQLTLDHLLRHYEEIRAVFVRHGISCTDNHLRMPPPGSSAAAQGA